MAETKALLQTAFSDRLDKIRNPFFKDVKEALAKIIDEHLSTIYSPNSAAIPSKIFIWLNYIINKLPRTKTTIEKPSRLNKLTHTKNRDSLIVSSFKNQKKFSTTKNLNQLATLMATLKVTYESLNDNFYWVIKKPNGSTDSTEAYKIILESTHESLILQFFTLTLQAAIWLTIHEFYTINESNKNNHEWTECVKQIDTRIMEVKTALATLMENPTKLNSPRQLETGQMDNSSPQTSLTLRSASNSPRELGIFGSNNPNSPRKLSPRCKLAALIKEASSELDKQLTELTINKDLHSLPASSSIL